jgi:hypothetical protein
MLQSTVQSSGMPSRAQRACIINHKSPKTVYNTVSGLEFIVKLIMETGTVAPILETILSKTSLADELGLTIIMGAFGLRALLLAAKKK